MKKYNIGLDIGTSSVGWAVVEANTQKIIKKGRKKDRYALWGVRTFEEATPAKSRREFRSTRRRYDRRRERIKLLQEEFQKEINMVDSNFFQKLYESKYHSCDEINKKIKLNKKDKETIKNNNLKYPTIYHLRNRLIEDTSKEDIRLVYLAIHHIIKYRGNFLYSNNFSFKNLDIKNKLIDVFETLVNNIPELEIPEDFSKIFDLDKMANIVLDESKNDIKENLKRELSVFINNKDFISEFVKMIIGYKFSVKKLCLIDDIEDIKIDFESNSYEDNLDKLQVLGEKIEVLDSLKELYDAIFLKKLFGNSNSINLSSLMIEKYNQHKSDLRFLKDLFIQTEYFDKIFKNKKDKCLYDKYVHNNITYAEFMQNIEKLILKTLEEKTNLQDKYKNVIEKEIANDRFLPRITDVNNGKYPYQLNKDELIRIIENQGKYYPFLLDKVDGVYKLVKLLEFRIPYYVGPLVSDKQSDFAWMERKEDGKITPYNFDKMIDKETTAEKFIKRMISHCTYLLDKDALPNNSILYCRYKVMNELKQIKINGVKLTNELQHKIMEELFLKSSGTITENKFKTYLYSLSDFSMYGNDINVTGYSADKKFANNMQSYYDFFGPTGIFAGTNYNIDDAEEIIEWITIFEDKYILASKVTNKYKDLSDDSLKNILTKKYTGWGSLSKELLTNKYYKDKKTGINKSILDLMYDTEENFMQILNNDEYKFQKMIKDENSSNLNDKLNYKLVENLATSPAVKKGIYQALKLVEEIIDYMGYSPENIVIEMARGEDTKKRTDNRKEYLIKLYKSSKEEIDNYQELIKELEYIDKIDSRKKFLYFIQEGKCLYSGRPLDFNSLDKYEIDHILPRTLVPDNSIDNLALVYREYNQAKTANFVLPKEYRNYKQIEWWKHLKKINLMSSKKFYNLTREKYDDKDIEGFINRQLVETRQITKHVGNIINMFYKDVNIIYLKASLSHNYREKYELFKFRDINDYHHAHDAYLAAVLGEYKEKYMRRNINFEIVKELNKRLISLGKKEELKYGYVINCLDERFSDIVNDISKNLVNEETGEVLFNPEHFNKIVENTLYRNDILVSRKSEIKSGQFYKQTIYPKGKGNIRIKENMPTEIYGGYNNVDCAYLTFVAYKNKKKLIGIPIEIATKEKNDKVIKIKFINNHLGVEEFEILKDKIPFESLINFDGQNVYIKGYSIMNKNCEVSNAHQLRIDKNNLKKWKHILNKVLNKVEIPKINSIPVIDDEKIIPETINIVKYLYSKKEEYPLFKQAITNIEDSINLNDLDFEQLSKLVIELLNIYQCNSTNGNLKEFGLSDRIGRLSGKNIKNGTLIFKSTTGIKKDEYEL